MLFKSNQRHLQILVAVNYFYFRSLHSTPLTNEPTNDDNLYSQHRNDIWHLPTSSGSLETSGSSHKNK